LDIGKELNKLTKVIVVGSEDVFEYFSSVWTQWDWANPAIPNAPWRNWDTQHPVADLDQMWNELNNGSLSAESEVVILNELSYSESNDEFETAIATFAPEALVLVISYDESLQSTIASKVAAKQAQLNISQEQFYFINTWEDPLGDIVKSFQANEVANAAKHQARQVNTNQATQSPAQPTEQRPATPGLEAVSPANQRVTEAVEESPYDGTRGLVIASTSSKGGSGKTTVAICTASMIYHASRLAFERGEAERPLNVCIVDMDTRDGQIGFLLNQTSPSALNIYVNPEKTIDVIKQNLIYDERLGIHALLAPKRARTADFLTPDFYKDIIEKLRTIFDVVILDTSVNYLDALLGQVVLPMADAVLFITNLSVGSVYGMTRWMDEVTSSVEDGGSGIPKEKIGIVVNQSLPNVGIDQKLLQQAASGATLLVAIPLDTAAVVAASNHNSLSDIVLKHNAISPSYYTLARKLWRTSALVSPMDELGGGNKKQVKIPPVAPAPASVAATPVAKKKRGGLFK
jgi:Flp pilus assembly CpaE family ATPase